MDLLWELLNSVVLKNLDQTKIMPRQPLNLLSLNRSHLHRCIQERNCKTDEGIIYPYHDSKCFLKDLFTIAKLEKLYEYVYDDGDGGAGGGGGWNKYDITRDNYCTLCEYKGHPTGAPSRRLIQRGATDAFLPHDLTYFPIIEAHYSNGYVFRKQFGCCQFDDDIYSEDNLDSLVETIGKYMGTTHHPSTGPLYNHP